MSEEVLKPLSGFDATCVSSGGILLLYLFWWSLSLGEVTSFSLLGFQDKKKEKSPQQGTDRKKKKRVQTTSYSIQNQKVLALDVLLKNKEVCDKNSALCSFQGLSTFFFLFIILCSLL